MKRTKQDIIYLVRGVLKWVLEVCLYSSLYVNISVNTLLPEIFYFIENIELYFKLQKDNV